jgi:hypothetical protein
MNSGGVQFCLPSASLRFRAVLKSQTLVFAAMGRHINISLVFLSYLSRQAHLTCTTTMSASSLSAIPSCDPFTGYTAPNVYLCFSWDIGILGLRFTGLHPLPEALQRFATVFQCALYLYYVLVSFQLTPRNFCDPFTGYTAPNVYLCFSWDIGILGLRFTDLHSFPEALQRFATVFQCAPYLDYIFMLLYRNPVATRRCERPISGGWR